MRCITLWRALCVAFTVTNLAAFAGDFRAGAGKSDIQTSPDMWPVDGFTSQHDPLSVRVLLLDDGKSRASLVVLDETSISESTVAKTKATIGRLTGVSAENTLVIASHTFSAPHLFGGPPATSGVQGQVPAGGAGPGGPPQAEQSPGIAAYSKAIEVAVETAAIQAKNTLQPARTGFGVGSSDVSVNRDVPTPRGWWLGSDPAGFSDKTVSILRIDSATGKPIAVLMNEAVQSSVMDHSENRNGGKPVSADVAGAATRFVEQQYGDGAIAFFLIGAAGDQAPVFQGNRYVLGLDGRTSRVDIHEDGFTLVNLIGERLGSEALQTSESIRATGTPTIQVLRKSIEAPSQEGSRSLPTEPVTAYAFKPGPDVQVPVVLLRIGDVVLVGLQAELAAIVGAQLKAHSPFAHTIVVTMVDGGAKYMPDEKSYDRFTYEARNSRYGRGAAEKVATAVDNLLKQMQ